MRADTANAVLFISVLQGFAGKDAHMINAEDDGAIPFVLLTLA
jgi:hypothetical protein